MKNWGGQFTPELGGHFELESGAHFKLELGGQYHRNMHTYDLTLLLRLDSIKDFVNSDSFGIMLLQVAKDDDKAIPNNKEWLYNHPREALIFSDTVMVWNVLKKVYTGTKFNELLIGNEKPPHENDVFDTLVFLSERIELISWEVIDK